MCKIQTNFTAFVESVLFFRLQTGDIILFNFFKLYFFGFEFLSKGEVLSFSTKSGSILNEVQFFLCILFFILPIIIMNDLHIFEKDNGSDNLQTNI